MFKNYFFFFNKCSIKRTVTNKVCLMFALYECFFFSFTLFCAGTDFCVFVLIKVFTYIYMRKVLKWEFAYDRVFDDRDVIPVMLTRRLSPVANCLVSK